MSNSNNKGGAGNADGTLRVDERLRDGKKRYEGRVLFEREIYEKSVKALKEIEKQIFANIDMKPEDIDDQNIEKIVSELRRS